jgi:hypothetical protein
MLKINNGNYICEYVDTSDNVILTYCMCVSVCVCPIKHLVLKTLILAVSVCIALYHINSDSSVTFIQGYVSFHAIIILSVFIFKHWMYLFYIPLY